MIIASTTAHAVLLENEKSLGLKENRLFTTKMQEGRTK